MARGTRDFTRIVDSLGQDFTGVQVPLDTSDETLVGLVDDLRFAKRAGGSARAWFGATPSVGGAARFSSVQFTTTRGLWIRSAAVRSNQGIAQIVQGLGPFGAFTVQDSLFNRWLLWSVLEDGDFADTAMVSLAQLIDPAFSNLPNLFPRTSVGFQIGQTTPGITGVEMFPTDDPLRDIWLPAGFSFCIQCTTAATTIQIRLELEFPPEYFFKG